MSTFPSPRMMAISTALLRRIRDGIAIAMVFASSAAALVAPLFFMVMLATHALLSFAGVPHAIIIENYLYPIFLMIALASASAWLLLCRPTKPSAGVASSPPRPFFHRAMMVCARGPEILISAFVQFLGAQPNGPDDPRVASLFSRYRNKLPPSGQGSILAALRACSGAIPASAIALGLLFFSLAGAVGFLLLSIPARLQAGAASSSLAAVQGWAGRVVDRLAAEGSADLAASEASLLDKSLPALPKSARAPRI